ncbi:hypothetical protein BDQ17DRAFT_1328061 [Cyathus striatus]|nr:hypothetical protein BDQ17DRAFT_1328061 [Cyathus striatus]
MASDAEMDRAAEGVLALIPIVFSLYILHCLAGILNDRQHIPQEQFSFQTKLGGALLLCFLSILQFAGIYIALKDTDFSILWMRHAFSLKFQIAIRIIDAVAMLVGGMICVHGVLCIFQDHRSSPATVDGTAKILPVYPAQDFTAEDKGNVANTFH